MSEINHSVGKQIAAARALLGLGQVELAKMANISAPTLRRMEAGSEDVKPMTNNIRAVISVLHGMGITFLGDGDRSVGLGVSLSTEANRT